ncbi:hypothetical protein Tco_0451677 [Tanacetum coccineum]
MREGHPQKPTVVVRLWLDGYSIVEYRVGPIAMDRTGTAVGYLKQVQQLHSKLKGSGIISYAAVLGFGDTFGSDEVFDLSAPSIFDSSPMDVAEKPLYDRPDLDDTQFTYGSKSNNHLENNSVSNDFVSCDDSDKSSDSDTTGFASCVSSVKSSSSKTNEPLQHGLFLKETPMNNVAPRASILFPLPAGSRKSPASVSAGSAFPAGSRNRPASLPAGRPFSTSCKNHAARPMTRPSRRKKKGEKGGKVCYGYGRMIWGILLDQQCPHTLHHLESLLTTSLDRLISLKEDLIYRVSLSHEQEGNEISDSMLGMRHHHLHLLCIAEIKQVSNKSGWKTNMAFRITMDNGVELLSKTAL